jgi:hypothetical protein
MSAPPSALLATSELPTELLASSEEPMPLAAMSTLFSESRATSGPATAPAAICGSGKFPVRSPPAGPVTGSPWRVSSSMSSPVSASVGTFAELTAPAAMSGRFTSPSTMSWELTVLRPGSAPAVPAMAKQNSAT